MNKLYRFRRCNDYSLDALFGNKIQGSKYCAMADPNEVLVTANVEEIKKITKLDEELIAQTVDVIRNHIINSYYISCFTTEDQTDNAKMWEEYAGTNGFCLVYDESLVTDAVRLSMQRALPVFHMFKQVEYGNEPTDITPLIKDYLRLVGDDIECEERHRFAALNAGKSLSAEERQRITGSMFRKIGNFTEKTEKRLVSLHSDHSLKFCDDMLGVPVKPIGVICSSLMPPDTFQEISEFAINNDIELSIKEIAD
ncbi:MAG: hypothetical protein SPL80_04015 [Bacilli bacterium]|nr:hypothetical protein [Bacilli bacterium]